MLTLFGLLTALPAVLALHLLEPELVLPAFSVLLFVEAAFAVIAARLVQGPDKADDITLWDLAGGFTLIGCAAAMFAEPDQAALFLTEQATRGRHRGRKLQAQWISAERFSAAFSFSSEKSGLRAISRIGVSRRPQSSAASGSFAATSSGITMAPC
ncbi:hypothetical protein ACVME8_007550 [Bradyrhizobium diazoefficiens]